MSASVTENLSTGPREGSFSVEREIARYIAGETTGHLLFDALYGEIANEPIPAEMLRIVRTARQPTPEALAAAVPTPPALAEACCAAG